MTIVRLIGPDDVNDTSYAMDNVPRKNDFIVVNSVEYSVEKVVWYINFEVAYLHLLRVQA